MYTFTQHLIVCKFLKIWSICTVIKFLRIITFIQFAFTVCLLVPKMQNNINEVYTMNFQTFFVWALLLIVHTWNSNPLRSNLLLLQCTRCTIQTTSRRPLKVLLCERVNDLRHSLFHLLNSLITATSELRELSKVTEIKVQTIERLRNCLVAHLGQIVYAKDGVVDWCIVLLEMPLTWFEECWSLSTESLPELP